MPWRLAVLCTRTRSGAAKAAPSIGRYSGFCKASRDDRIPTRTRNPGLAGRVGLCGAFRPGHCPRRRQARAGQLPPGGVAVSPARGHPAPEPGYSNRRAGRRPAAGAGLGRPGPVIGQPCIPQTAGGGRAGAVPARRRNRGRFCAPGRLGRPQPQRMLGGQPVHDQGAAPYPPARHRAVCQRLAAGADRAEKPRRRGRRHLEGLRPDSDLQRTDPRPVSLQRVAGDFRRQRGPPGQPVGQRRAFHAVAHHRRGEPGPAGRIQRAANAGAGRAGAAGAAGLFARLCAVRGRWPPG